MFIQCGMWIELSIAALFARCHHIPSHLPRVQLLRPRPARDDRRVRPCRPSTGSKWAGKPRKGQIRGTGRKTDNTKGARVRPAAFKRSLKTYFYVQCFINIVFITFSPRVVDTVKCHWSNFFIYDTLILTIYITIHVRRKKDTHYKAPSAWSPSDYQEKTISAICCCSYRHDSEVSAFFAVQ